MNNEHMRIRKKNYGKLSIQYHSWRFLYVFVVVGFVNEFVFQILKTWTNLNKSNKQIKQKLFEKIKIKSMSVTQIQKYCKIIVGKSFAFAFGQKQYCTFMYVL